MRVDQAILYLHLIGGNDPQARIKLRDYGIRTATDLQVVWDKASQRLDNSLLSLKTLLGSEGDLNRLEAIEDALSDDEWMKVVSCWRDEREPNIVSYPAIPTSADSLEKRGDKEVTAARYSLALIFYQKSVEVRDTAMVRSKIDKLLEQSSIAKMQDQDEAK